MIGTIKTDLHLSGGRRLHDSSIDVYCVTLFEQDKRVKPTQFLLRMNKIIIFRTEGSPFSLQYFYFQTKNGHT